MQPTFSISATTAFCARLKVLPSSFLLNLGFTKVVGTPLENCGGGEGLGLGHQSRSNVAGRGSSDTPPTFLAASMGVLVALACTSRS